MVAKKIIEEFGYWYNYRIQELAEVSKNKQNRIPKWECEAKINQLCQLARGFGLNYPSPYTLAKIGVVFKNE